MIPHNETEKTSGKNIEFEPVVRISKASRYAAKGLTHVAGPFLFGIANQVPGMVQNGDVVTRDLASAAWQRITGCMATSLPMRNGVDGLAVINNGFST